jgi:membrane-bound serine protease (ClpP class)
MRRFGFIAVWSLLLGATVHAAQVGLIKIDGAIGPATASYIARALDTAAAQHDECLILQLDTPGGLATSMSDIVKEFYASPIPTVVYVAPEGAMADSAGCYITEAATIAAMAPNTSIGAAHPVELGGFENLSTNSVMMQKVGNTFITVMGNIAAKRHRNVDWAKSAVQDSVVLNADEALSSNVVDLVAKDLPDLLKQLDGRQADDKTLRTANAIVVEIPMNTWEKFDKMFLRPEIMFVLMLLVIYGLIGELSSPGAILPGVAGAIALVLVLYMTSVLPVNVAGLVLMGLAVLLFIADIFAPTHGILTTGGILAFFLGALMLFNHGGPGYELSLRWIISGTLLTAAFFFFVVGKGIGAQFKPAQTGTGTMIGKTVSAQSRIDSAGGRVFIEGENWNAISDLPVEAGQTVEVTGIDGLTLRVKPTTKT